jgi:hypothetical protein
MQLYFLKRRCVAVDSSPQAALLLSSEMRHGEGCFPDSNVI